MRACATMPTSSSSPGPRARRRRTAVVAALAALAALVLAPAAAQALMVNNGTPFGVSGTAGGQFGSSSPQGVAVNQANGDVYVTDPGNARVEEFSSAGTFIRTWGWGVSDGMSQFEICTSSCEAGSPGTGAGQFTDPTSIAVDSSGGASNGDVYVGDAGNDVVEKFGPTGTYVATITGAGTTSGTEGPTFGAIAGIAVDQNGDLWVADGGTNDIVEFGDTGTFVQEWPDTYGTTVTIAVDSNTNAVYLIRGTAAAERWTLDGTGETTVDSGDNTELAVDPATGDLYTANTSSGNAIHVWSSTNTEVDQFAARHVTTMAGLAYYDSAGSTTPSENGNLYISDSSGNDVTTFVPPSAGPPEIDAESSSNVGANHATVSAQVNPFGIDTSCVFQYVTDAAYMSTGFAGAPSVPCTPSDLGMSFQDQTATAQLTGLQPSTEYDFQVVAKNTAGTVDGSAPAQVGDQTFTTTAEPSIDSTSVTNVTATDATLGAAINPNGGDTTYQFQFDGQTVPANPIDIGSGTSDVDASVALTGLEPSTTYTLNVLADGAYAGPSVSFTTYPANLPTGLPDNRAYEMVTPPNKDNGEPFDRSGDLFGLQASTTGDGLGYFSFNAFSGSVFDGSYYLAGRGPDSWVSQNVIPPQSTEGGLLCASLGAVMEAYSPDLSTGILADGGSLAGTCGQDSPPLVPGEPQGVQNLFVRNNTAGTYQLVDADSAGQPAPATSPTPATANFDAATPDMSHVVFDESAQLTNGAPSGDDLYEWSGGTVTLVTYLPNGTPVVGSLAGGSAGNAFNAVSDDGSKVFFTANGNLYVRENGTSTAQVDAPAPGGAGPGGGGTFLAATPDGSNVYFTDPDTAGLTANTISGSGANLYDYNVSSGTLTDLTPVATADVDGVTGMSSDGSYLYFVANGDLASGATAGDPNLYLLHAGTITFLATLGGGDSCDWTPSCLSARVSSNGAYVAFTSTSQLTGYQNDGVPEIYLSGAGGGAPVCASCNPDGVPPTAGASIGSPYFPTLLGSGAQYLQHYVSNAGQVFFDTPDSLLPRASNGVSDVYEYENGALYLISSGTNADPDYFVDASPSGSDVFFMTSQQLVPQDTDGAVDIYDARVDGGFPPSAPPPTCSGDGCKPPPTPAPPVPVAGSVIFSGPGNATPGPPGSALVISSHRALKGFRFAVVVLVPEKGVITISGAGLKTVRRSVKRAGQYTLVVGVTANRRQALNARNRRKLKILVHIGYRPATGASTSATFTLTLKA